MNIRKIVKSEVSVLRMKSERTYLVCMVGGLRFVVMFLSVQLKLISFTVTFSGSGI
jgi:hypothetical protein